METTVIGYQYSPEDGHYVGEYAFPNNKDKAEIHLPPYTTLTAPPSYIPVGLMAYFENGEWVIREDNDPLTTVLFPDVPFDLLDDAFLDHMKKIGLYQHLLQFYENRPDLRVAVSNSSEAQTVEVVNGG